MTKRISILIVLFNIFQLKSQVVFCPPGAQWNYSFIRNNMSSTPSFDNVPIKYVRDTIISGDTSHVLTHDRYFGYPNLYISSNPLFITLIKQRGDTVFMRNSYTNNEWRILYNFACPPGQCWQTTLGPLTFTNAAVYTYCVDSVKYIQYNGQSLKTLYLGPNLTITERYGASTYLFPFNYSSMSDGDYCRDFLCYKDNEHGTKQFSSKPCDYTYIVGLNESKDLAREFEIYPNPTRSKLILKSENDIEQCEIKLLNTLNQIALHKEININEETELDLSFLANGIYFLQVYERENLVGTKKIVKE